MNTERSQQRSLKSESGLADVVSYTPKQIERIYGIKKPTIRSWIRQGKIKGGKAGRLVLIDAKDFQEKYQNLIDTKDFFDA
jgi:excisionase family DNA binding protein